MWKNVTQWRLLARQSNRNNTVSLFGTSSLLFRRPVSYYAGLGTTLLGGLTAYYWRYYTFQTRFQNLFIDAENLSETTVEELEKFIALKPEDRLYSMAQVNFSLLLPHEQNRQTINTNGARLNNLRKNLMGYPDCRWIESKRSSPINNQWNHAIQQLNTTQARLSVADSLNYGLYDLKRHLYGSAEKTIKEMA